MDTLLTLLHSLEASALPDDMEEILHRGDHPHVIDIEGLAIDLFISSSGDPLFHEIDQLWETHGFFIFPGERDRCGWITACLQTKKGIIVFG